MMLLAYLLAFLLAGFSAAQSPTTISHLLPTSMFGDVSYKASLMGNCSGTSTLFVSCFAGADCTPTDTDDATGTMTFATGQAMFISMSSAVHDGKTDNFTTVEVSCSISGSSAICAEAVASANGDAGGATFAVQTLAFSNYGFTVTAGESGTAAAGCSPAANTASATGTTSSGGGAGGSSTSGGSGSSATAASSASASASSASASSSSKGGSEKVVAGEAGLIGMALMALAFL